MEYYDETYFDWQKNIGAFGGQAELFKFEGFIQEDFNVIDFGSGGGDLLSNIKCNGKIGVEINESARRYAKKLGIATVKAVDEVPDQWADLIISNHALEHVENPVNELRKLYKKLKIGGKVVLVVPHEKSNPYKASDINFHLYTWSEMNLGNLFTHAGYHVIEVKEIVHKWPPNFMRLRKVFGKKGFDSICRVYGRINKSISQIRIVATKLEAKTE